MAAAMHSVAVMRIEWDVPIAMDDGIVLRADVFLPDGDERVPAILTYGPYAKGLAFQEGYPDQWKRMIEQHPDVAAGSTNAYANWEVVDPEKWVPHGYACVRVDSRGAGRSPGFLDPWSPRETRDFAACIEWAAAQPWCTGKVGLCGISYYAMNQWTVAGLQPRGLSAMCAWEGAADFYRDFSHHGGILSTFLANWYDMQVTTVQHGLGERGPRSPITGEPACGPQTLSEQELAAHRSDFGNDVRAHVLDDEYHRARSPDWERVTTPFLSAANWGGQGLHPRGNFEAFTRAASSQKWLEVHGLEHWTHFYTDYGRGLQKRFFDYFLKGEANGWDREPRVHLQVRRLDGFVERCEDGWPLASTRWTRFYLQPDGCSLSTELSQTSARLEYDALGDGLTFLAAPLERETEITGPLAARLFVSSSTSDADLFVVFRAFAPSGEEVVFQGAIDPHTPLAQGWLRASHRKLDEALSREWRPYHLHDDVQPLIPFKPEKVDVEIWPTSIVLPPGYCLALTVRGKDYA
ncbi:MAG: CocE/NonD family hydrolase, partial [Candidatus Eremiobacteraeota bacterium]|nr:CocE/NonD family hydrolase [Candidatus Eremiobacteraeota bacterium]